MSWTSPSPARALRCKLLAATGGFLDAYTYVARGRVFANAQTGNLVLLGLRAFETDPQALRYLVPVCAFVLGIVLSEFLKARKRALHPVNWRQAVLGVCAISSTRDSLTAICPCSWNQSREWRTSTVSRAVETCGQTRSFSPSGHSSSGPACSSSRRQSTYKEK